MKNKDFTEKQTRRMIIIFTIFVVAYFSCNVVFSKTLKVAVIDTGFDFSSEWKNVTKLPIFCKTFNYNVSSSLVFDDEHGHGTHVTGLVGKYAHGADYCIYSIKFYNTKDPEHNIISSYKAFQKAIDLKVDFINYSGGGPEYNAAECHIVKKALNKGIIVVTAAGNEGKSFDEQPYYPANCDHRVIVVSSMDKFGNRLESSNWGPGVVKEQGLEVLSLIPNNKLGFMTGTSQATAIYTGKLIKQKHDAIKGENACLKK